MEFRLEFILILCVGLASGLALGLLVSALRSWSARKSTPPLGSSDPANASRIEESEPGFTPNTPQASLVPSNLCRTTSESTAPQATMPERIWPEKKWEELDLQLRQIQDLSPSLKEIASTLRHGPYRGFWGERQLETLLAHLLPAQSYRLQSPLPSASPADRATERVDALIRLGEHWLPVDCKFPREGLDPLFEAPLSDPSAVKIAQKLLADRLRQAGRDIRRKYVHPLQGTTEFGLLYLPSESIYLEALKHPTLTLELEKERIYLCSGQTLGPFLQMLNLLYRNQKWTQNAKHALQELHRARRHLDLLGDRMEETSKFLRKASDSHLTSLNHFHRLSSQLETPTPLEPETPITDETSTKNC